MMGKDNKISKKQANAEKLISLKPLEFDEAVSDLLKVKPKGKNKQSNTHNQTGRKVGKTE